MWLVLRHKKGELKILQKEIQKKIGNLPELFCPINADQRVDLELLDNTVNAYSPVAKYTGESNIKVVALGVEVLAVILSGFNVFSENGMICEALGIPFTTGLICTVTGRLESFA